MAEQYGTYHLADNAALFEPTRSNNFEFIVTDFDNLIYAGTNRNLITEADYIHHGQDAIRFSVVEASVPNFELSTIEVKRGNNTAKFAGTPTFGAGTLRLNDFIDTRTKDVLLAWQALAYDVVTEKVHRADNYKKDCRLIEYSPDYNTIVRSWLLKGCWVSAISEGSFNMESNEKRTFEATIQFDRAIPERPTEA